MSILWSRLSGFGSCPRSQAILHKGGKITDGRYYVGLLDHLSSAFSFIIIQRKKLHWSSGCYLQVTMLFDLVVLISLTIRLSHIPYGHFFLFSGYSSLFCYLIAMLVDLIFTVHHLLQLDVIKVALLIFCPVLDHA